MIYACNMQSICIRAMPNKREIHAVVMHLEWEETHTQRETLGRATNGDGVDDR